MRSESAERPDNYKWIALFNTTLGVVMATIDSSIVLIALPDIFKGIKLDPLIPSNRLYMRTLVGHLPPVSILFGAFLGYSPVQHLVGTSVLAHLPPHQAAILVGRSFFPNLISSPFRSGLHAAFDFAILACLVAAVASWLRGGRYHWRDEEESANVGSISPVHEPVGVQRAG